MNQEYRDYIWDWPEYWELSCKYEDTCCHSDSIEVSPFNAGVVSADHRIKLKEFENKDISGNWKKKNMEHEGDNYTNSDWCFWYSN